MKRCMYKRLLLSAVMIWSLSACAQTQRVVKEVEHPTTGSWGDQGDGTFRNPVLNSNYPDSDVEKFGEKWYMISSKGRYMKGMTILESEDLVNWSIVGGIVDSVDWYDTGEENGEGVWAGDLVHHEGRWYCYFIDISKGLFVCTSDDIRGPWNKPILLMERKGMTDPSVYFDKEKNEGYLVCNYEIVGTGDKRIYYNKLFRLSWDGFEIFDKGTDIYVESGAEAAKIYKVNGYFYLFFSEWTTDHQGKKDDRRQIVLRSKEITGPYEKKVLLERDPFTGRSSSQGALVQVPDGSWWYFHQLIQRSNTYEGRPQCLIPVSWEDGWPILGADPDGNGIGNTVWANTKPVPGKAIRAPQTDDDFNSSVLAPQWLWDGNPINHLWSLEEAKGNMRLYGTSPSNTKGNSYRTLPNKLLQRKMGKATDTITTKMNYAGLHTGQSAGLIITGHNLSVIGVEHTASSGKQIYVERESGTKYYAPLEDHQQEIYLRAIIDRRQLRLLYSQDGIHFQEFGEVYTMETKGFNGLFLGLFCKNDTPYQRGYADFDWFDYRYDGPKHIQLIN